MSGSGSSGQIWDLGKDRPALVRKMSKLAELREDEEDAGTEDPVTFRAKLSSRFLTDNKTVIQSQLNHGLQSFMEKSLSNFEPIKQVFKLKEGVYVQMSVIGTETAFSNQALKSDLFFGLHKLKEPNRYKGSSNFRQVKSEAYPIFGVSQPLMEGIEEILKGLLKEDSYSRVVWINLREEPVLYVNGSPFSPREKHTLNINLEYLLGIASHNLEDLEERFRADVIHLAKQNGNKVDYYFQNEAMENELKEESATPSDIHTLKYVYRRYFDNGYYVNYFRVPITDECAPDLDDLDRMVELFRDAGPDCAFVFNCQMGRGRTTTGMVCACLYYIISDKFRRELSPVRAASKLLDAPTLPEEFSTPEQKYLAGHYKVIIDFLLAYNGGDLQEGLKVKQITDKAIDDCDTVQNLRTAIYQCKKIAESDDEKTPEKASKEFWRKRAMNYLERYLKLILFTQYLYEQVPVRFHLVFSDWMKQRWGIQRFIRNMSLE